MDYASVPQQSAADLPTAGRHEIRSLKLKLRAWIEQSMCPACGCTLDLTGDPAVSGRLHALVVEAYCRCGAYRSRIELSTCAAGLDAQEDMLAKLEGAGKRALTRALSKYTDNHTERRELHGSEER